MKNLHPDTLSLHAGQVPDPVTGARAVPIYQTSSYVFKDSKQAADLFALKEFGNIYTRLMNPTTEVLEKRLSALEGGSGALATASGMSAIFLAIHNIAGVGDHMVSSSSLYGGTETLFRYTLKQMGIETTFVEADPEKIQAAVKENTKAVYIETIGNPKGDVPDIEGIAEATHEAGIPLIIDNTFAPTLCYPFRHGADIIVYSCTKWIGGHGTSIGGAIVDSGTFNWGSGRFPAFTEPDESYHGMVYWDSFKETPEMGNIAYIIKARVQGMRNIGPCLSPQNAFLLLQGLETLPLRMERHCDNAMKLAEWLREQKETAWVSYTGLEDHPWRSQAEKYLNNGFGSVLGFGLKGGKKAGEKFINSLKLVSHLANVGDAKTLALHPASTSHQQLTPEARDAAGVTDDFIRVSVGLEYIGDIIEDFKQAMK